MRRVGTGYELVAGERRLRAAMLAGLTEVPCIVMQMDDRESGLAALVENLQRQDLDFIEEASGIQKLMELGSMSQEQAARLLGKSQSALLKLRDESLKLTAIREISRQSMSVAQTEKYIASLLRGKPEAAARANVGAFLNSLTQSLSRIQRNGIPAVSERRETDSQIVLTITIPKEKAPSSPE